MPSVPNGFKYRVIGAGNVLTGSTEPVWPTTVGNTVVDNAITWTCVAADSNDILGHVYQPGESGFDPNGYIKTIADNDVGSFDKKIAIIQIGQSDAAGLTSIAHFRDSYITAANWLLGRGFKVFMGLSFGNPAYTTAYINTLRPAITEALAHFSSNSSVLRGVDMFAAFGESPPASDGGVHVTQEVLRQAGELWAGIVV